VHPAFGMRAASNPIIIARQLRMTNGGEHGVYLPGAAESHIQVYEERVLWYKLAQRSGGCGDLIGFRSEQPLIRCRPITR
jgi:hypothetical protein